MAFCASCGNEVIDTAVICVKCGSSIGSAKEVKPEETKWSTGQMVGLGVGSFVIPFVGIGAGIYGICKEPKRTQGIILVVIGVLAMSFWKGFFGA